MEPAPTDRVRDLERQLADALLKGEIAYYKGRADGYQELLLLVIRTLTPAGQAK